MAEKQKLIRWIDQGTPETVRQILQALVLMSEVFLGEPDIVLTCRRKNTGNRVIDYRYVPVELNLDRDVWISGMEFVPEIVRFCTMLLPLIQPSGQTRG